MAKDQSLATSTGVVRSLRSHLAAGCADVHMVYLRSMDHHNAEGGVVAVARKGHHMGGVGEEDSPPCVVGEDYAVRSHHDRSSPVAWLVDSARDNVVGDCIRAEALVYHIHPQEGIRDVAGSGIGMGHDMELSLQQVGPEKNERFDLLRAGKNVTYISDTCHCRAFQLVAIKLLNGCFEIGV